MGPARGDSLGMALLWGSVPAETALGAYHLYRVDCMWIVDLWWWGEGGTKHDYVLVRVAFAH